ncbi:7295_t:CDS:2 [Entrophospora sp. SA101]|nr:7295_t:CDS:2 [Entrophospora sp. SA101]
MSTQSQLPVIHRRQSLESPTHPLVIPEILENIFRYLPTTALVRVTYVSKLWRLGARNKLYQNRSEIIYDFHKWFLNTFRLKWGIPQQLMPDFHVSIAKAKKFRELFKSHELFHVDPGNIVNYANYQKLDRE